MKQSERHGICRSFFSLLFSLLLLAAVIACGNSGDTGTTPTPTPTPTGESYMTLSVGSIDVVYGTPVTATATLVDANGLPVAGAVVSFAETGSLISFTPVSATALTSASGVASIILNAAAVDSEGATSITASASVTTDGATATVTSAPVGLAVGGSAITLGTLTVGTSPISAYGTSSISVPVLVDGSPADVPIAVTFTSSCVAAGKATLDSPVATVAGTATSTYMDNKCAGTDTITARVAGATATATITVNPPATSNIQFVSAEPEIIATSTASTASLPTSSIVKFKVVDSRGNGKPGVLVNFTTVPPSPTDLFSLSATSATSDANGEVTTTLSSGAVPTTVWVKATVNGTALTSQSNTLRITTGLPTQDRFSLSIQTLNIEGLDYDGETSAITVIASDRLGNPVPDGTAINFITEGAQITPASCTTAGGTCTTTITSAEERPDNGRVSILAYAIGEKSFVDANSNNLYDDGETFYDIGDPFIDTDESGAWQAGEFSIASSTAGSSACRTQPGAGALPARYGSALSKANTCTAEWGENYVRRNAVIVLSGSHATVAPTSVNMANTCSKEFQLSLYDVNENPMPAETTIKVGEVNQVFYTPFEETTQTKAEISVPYGTPVLSTTSSGGTPFTLWVEADCSEGAPEAYPSGYVDLLITTPNGNVTPIRVTVTSTEP